MDTAFPHSQRWYVSLDQAQRKDGTSTELEKIKRPPLEKIFLYKTVLKGR